jgi:glycerol kinase
MKIIKTASESQELIKGLKDTNGVYFVPAFTGLGAPYWDTEARGTITGLTRGANQAHMTRAALESIVYQTKDVFDIMKSELGKLPRSLKVDGGACQNDFLMQFQADMLNCRIVRPKMVDSTVLGAGQLAGITVGLWHKNDILRMHKSDRTFHPKMKKSDRDRLYTGWQKAVRQAKT